MSDEPRRDPADDLERLRRLDRLTVDEAANYLRCSRRTVYRLIADRRFPVLKVRSATFLRRADLDRFLRGAGQAA